MAATMLDTPHDWGSHKLLPQELAERLQVPPKSLYVKGSCGAHRDQVRQEPAV